MKKEQDPEYEYPHWNRVYAAVAIYTITLILLIWGFSRIF
jgi:hypothetical protein